MRRARGLSTSLRKSVSESIKVMRRAYGLHGRRRRKDAKTYPLVGGLFVTQRKIRRHSLLTTLFFLLPRL